MERTYSYLLPGGRPARPASWVNSRFVNWFIDFDENTLRPFLIRKYNIDNIVLADQLEDVMNRKMQDDDDNLNVSARMIDIINMQNSFLANSQVKMSSVPDLRSKSGYQANVNTNSDIDIAGLKGTAVSQRGSKE